ncbi:MAG: (2Fe-2S)-binding protein, partial [Deltaproteobacteria bacterium]|nr:(2Fe-2S)-binding protein [Deltaproteobacteria bacterium]
GGKDILTIEGLAEGGELHPLQSSFVEKGGLQCGFCTPGMILTAKAILNEEENPTEDVIKRKMAGNLCRCTGYKKVVEAVMSANESDENAGRPEGQEA